MFEHIGTGLLRVAAPVLILALSPGSASGTDLAFRDSWDAADLPGRPHIELLASEPGDGDTLSVEPERIRLVFSGTVEEALSEIRLSGPGGLVLALDVAADPDTDRGLVADVPALSAGAYRISWRTVSVDGHAISGSIVFYLFIPEPVAARDSGRDSPFDGAPGEVAASQDGDAQKPTARFEPPPAEGEWLGIAVPPSLALSRGAAVAALLALGGLLLMIVWVAPGRARRAAALGYFLAFLVPVLLALHLLLWLRSVSPGGTLDIEKIPALLGTRAGGLELLRLGLAVAILAALAFGRHVGSAALLALFAVFVSGATGHALSTDPAISVPAKTAHLLATQLWLGGLLYLVLEARDTPEYRAATRRFSRAAFVAVLVVVVTGMAQTWVAVPSLGSLFATTYGRLVLAKSAGLFILVLFGYRHQVRLLPRLEAGEEGAAGRLRISVLWEVLCMALVFALAALLAYVQPPA